MAFCLKARINSKNSVLNIQAKWLTVYLKNKDFLLLQDIIHINLYTCNNNKIEEKITFVSSLPFNLIISIPSCCRVYIVRNNYSSFNFV